MPTWIREIRHAARVLWTSRTATIVAFLSLALAIGATSAIFTVVDATLLRPLPFPDADRLVQLARGYQNGGVSPAVSVPKFIAWRAGGEAVFTQVAAYDNLGSGFNLIDSDRPDRVTGSRVSAGFFDALGVRPAAGRGFQPDEDVPGGPKLVVLSHALWKTRFGARADLVGAAITLNNEPHTVVGVMPEGFRFPDRADLWTLFQFDPASLDSANYFEVVGRLRDGVPIDRARAAMAVVARNFRQAHPEMPSVVVSVAVRPLRERLYGDLRTPLLVLLSAVLLVLLIACVNVANLQLAQMTGRSHEIALRTALGAGRWAIVRQLLLESLLLAAIGGAAGVGLALAGVPALLALSPVDVPQAGTIGVDLRVLAATLAVSLAAGLSFGLLPAWQAARPNLDDLLRAGSRRSTGGAGGWLRRILIAGEVALALVLTIGAFLLVKSLAGLRSTDPGFAVDRVLTLKLSLPEAKYGSGEALARFQERLEARLDAIPGVAAASMAFTLPLELGPDLPFTIEGRYVPGSQAGVGEAQYRASGAAYFTALRIPVRRGRLFDDRDRRGSLPVAVVNEAAARRFFGGADPVGQRITIGQPYVPELADAVPREIVGVVADVREQGLDRAAPEIVYVPLAQQNDALTRLGVRLLPLAVVLRGDGPASGLTQAAREAVRAVDPQQPVSDVRLMRDIVARSLGSQTFNTVLLGGLAGLALLLAAVGLYGVIAHLVGQQTREIGVRMALGATQGGVLRRFVGHALLLVGAGVIAGLVGAVGVTRFLRTLLTGVSVTDPWVFVLAPALLLLVAVAAALRPAWRAASIDPASALRD